MYLPSGVCLSVFDFLSTFISVHYYGIRTGSLFYLYIWKSLQLPSGIPRVDQWVTFSKTAAELSWWTLRSFILWAV